MTEHRDLGLFAYMHKLLADDYKHVAVKFNLKEKGRGFSETFMLYRVDGGEAVDQEYKSFLKIILRSCAKHLNHLRSIALLSRQVYQAVEKSSTKVGFRGYDRILYSDAFGRIFDKHFNEHNHSYCFYLILDRVLKHNIKHLYYNLEDEDLNKGFVPITSDEYHAAKYQATASQEHDTFLSGHDILAWRIDGSKQVDIDFYASKLLILLLSIGDIESIVDLLSCTHFTVQDASTLAQCIAVAMTKGDQYLLNRIKGMLQKIEPHHPAIVQAETQLRRYDLLARSSVSIEAINSMSGTDFEITLKSAFETYPRFASVQTTPASGDFGADLIVSTIEGTRIAIQCKRFATKVNLKAVQEVVAAVNHYACDLGVVISNNGFLPSARQLAESNGIELWDGEAVLKIFAKQFDFSEIFTS